MPRDDEPIPTADVHTQLICDDRAHTVTVDGVSCAPSADTSADLPAKVPAARAPSLAPGAGPEPAPTDQLLRLLAAATSVPQLLDAVADLAVDAVAGADAAVICVVRDNAPATFAASRGMITMLDSAQFATGEGPSFQALCTRRTVQVDDVPGWRGAGTWRELAGTLDISAALAMPVTVTADAAATLSLYRNRGGGWSPEDLDDARRYTAHLADLLMIADRLTADDRLRLTTP